MKIAAFVFLMLSFSVIADKNRFELDSTTEKAFLENLNRVFGTNQFEFDKYLNVGDSGAKLAVITVNKKRLVLRIISYKKTFDQVASEIWATKLASLLKVGPKVYFSDVDHRIILIDYIEQTGGYSFQNIEQSANELANLLQRLKSLNLNRKDRMFIPNLEKFQSWDLNKLPTEYRKMCKETLKGVLEAYKYFENFTPMLSHNDLHFENVILSDDKLYVIDWETFSISNLPFEMAAIIYRTIVSEDAIPTLLKKSYGHDPNEVELAEFRVASIIYAFLRSVQDLDKLGSDQRMNIKMPITSLPKSTDYLQSILKTNQEITDSKKTIYGWSLFKRAHEMISAKTFRKDLKLLKHHQKKQTKEFLK